VDSFQLQMDGTVCLNFRAWGCVTSRTASPQGQLCLVKEVCSLLLREVGWVCRLAEEQKRSSSAVRCHSSVDSAGLTNCTRACGSRSALEGRAPRCGTDVIAALLSLHVPSQSPQTSSGRWLCWLAGAWFKFCGRHFQILMSCYSSLKLNYHPHFVIWWG